VIVQYPIEEEKGSVGSSSLHVEHYLRAATAWEEAPSVACPSQRRGGVPDNPVVGYGPGTGHPSMRFGRCSAGVSPALPTEGPLGRQAVCLTTLLGTDHPSMRFAPPGSAIL